MRRDEIARKKALRAMISKGKKAKKEKKMDMDVNKDGKVDEKDVELVKKAASKKKKKIIKKD